MSVLTRGSRITHYAPSHFISSSNNLCMRFWAPCAASQDFNVDVRVDPLGGRRNDSPAGANPAAILVREGIVDVSDILAVLNSPKLAPGKSNRNCVQAVCSLEGYSFRDPLVAMYNLSSQPDKQIAVVIFQQARRGSSRATR